MEPHCGVLDSSLAAALLFFEGVYRMYILYTETNRMYILYTEN